MDCDVFEALVADAIRRDALLVADLPVLVGLSGGADSVALLAVLCRLGYDCKAVHCNFHLRGNEALRDQNHAVDVAARLGVTCQVVDFDTRSYMQQHGVSLEMACRELRYARFRDLMSEYGAQAIAVAHHRDDNVETLFLNMLRGSGLHGLRGMLPRQGDVVRPLLGVTRADIEQYLSHIGLTYVVDSSNVINDTARNRLRNIVIPELRRQFPNADRAIASTIAILRSNEQIYNAAILDFAKRYVADDGHRIALARIVAEQDEAPTILFELIREFGFNADQVSDIIRSCDNSGRRFFSDKYEAIINRGSLLLMPIQRDAHDHVGTIADFLDASTWAIPCSVEMISRSEFAPNKGDADVLYLAADALDDNPVWAIRQWRDGDRMKPFGMNGSRKLSDIFSDAKLSIVDKQAVRLLTRNDEIVWAIGLRSSKLFPVLSDTERIVKITLLNSDNKA